MLPSHKFPVVILENGHFLRRPESHVHGFYSLYLLIEFQMFRKQHEPAFGALFRIPIASQRSIVKECSILSEIGRPFWKYKSLPSHWYTSIPVRWLALATV